MTTFIHEKNLQANVSNVHYQDDTFKIFVKEEEMLPESNFHSIQHIHKEIEMMLITKGYLYYNINDEVIRINEGDMIFVNSMQMHSSFLKESKGCQFIVILIHPSVFSTDPFIYANFANPIFNNQNIDYFIFENHKELNFYFNLMTQAERSHESAHKLTLMANAYNILKCLYDKFKNHTFEMDPRTNEEILLLNKMTSFIYTHYSEKLSLSDIAQCGNVSISKCSRMFNHYTHHSPVDFLNLYRLEVASNLLRSSKESISSISFSCGFEQQSYFNKMFKKEYHCTPLQYRKQPVDQFVH